MEVHSSGHNYYVHTGVMMEVNLQSLCLLPRLNIGSTVMHAVMIHYDTIHNYNYVCTGAKGLKERQT